MLKRMYLMAGAALAAVIAFEECLRKQKYAVRSDASPSSLSSNLSNLIIPTASAVGAIILFTRMSHGKTLRYTFVPTMAVSWILYIRYLRQSKRDQAPVVPFYLLALAWQFVHFVEEYTTGFQRRWPREIFHAKPYGDKQFVAINLISYAAFVMSGVALLRNRKEFYLPAVFFAVMGVMFNGVQHPIYSVMVKGYFPGLWTGLVDLVLGPVLLKRLLFAAREERVLSTTAEAA